MNYAGAQTQTENRSETCDLTVVEVLNAAGELQKNKFLYCGRNLDKSFPLEVMFQYAYTEEPNIIPGSSQFNYEVDGVVQTAQVRLTVFDFIVSDGFYVGVHLEPHLDDLDPATLTTDQPIENDTRHYRYYTCLLRFVVMGQAVLNRNISFITTEKPEIYSPDNIVPDFPLNIRVTVGMEQEIAYAKVDWDEVVGSKYYTAQICLDNNQTETEGDLTGLPWETNKWEQSTELASTVFSPLLVQYYYVVRVRATGTVHTGEWAYKRFLVDDAAGQLDAPQNVSVIALGYLTLRLTWDPPANATTVPVDLYVICRSETGNPDYTTGWTKIAVTDANTRHYTDLPTNADPESTNKTFYYYVYAVSKFMVIGAKSPIVHATVRAIEDYTAQTVDLSTALGELDGSKITNGTIIGAKIKAATVDLNAISSGTLNAAKITGGLLQAYGGSFASRMVSTTFEFAKQTVTGSDVVAITYGTLNIRVATLSETGCIAWTTQTFTPATGVWKDVSGAGTLITSPTYTVASGTSRYGYIHFDGDAAGEPTNPSELRWSTYYPTGLYDMVLVWVSMTTNGLAIEPIYTKGGTVISGDHIATGSIQAEQIGAKAVTAEKINAGAILAYTADFVNRLRSCDVAFTMTPGTGGVTGCQWTGGIMKLNGYTYSETDAINQATFGPINVTINNGSFTPTCDAGHLIVKKFLYVTYDVNDFGEPATGQTLSIQTPADTYPEGLHDIVLALVGFQYHTDTGKISGIITPATPTGTTIDGDHISTGSIHASDIRTGILRGWQGTGNYFDLDNGKIYLSEGNSLDDQITQITPAWDNITSKPGFIGATAPATGLYLSSSALGYLNAGNWATYMDNNGHFYLGGTNGSGAALAWNGTALTISSAQQANLNTSYITNGKGYTDDTAANAARGVADAAKTNADSALATLTNIASDSKLTPVEKKAVQCTWDSIVTEETKYVNQAAALVPAVSSTAYANAYTALFNYVVPLLVDLTATSDIVGTTFRSTFQTYYDARADLLNAMTASVSTHALTSTYIKTFRGTTVPSSYSFPAGHPMNGDLYIQVADGVGATETPWVYNGSWQSNTMYMDGSHLTIGSITADKVNVSSLIAGFTVAGSDAAEIKLTAGTTQYGSIIFKSQTGVFANEFGSSQTNVTALNVAALKVATTQGVLGLGATTGINLFPGTQTGTASTPAIRCYGPLYLPYNRGLHWVVYDSSGNRTADTYLTSDGTNLTFHDSSGNSTVLGGSATAKFA